MEHSDITPADILAKLENTEELESCQASGVISGFRANCNAEVATDNGTRIGKSLAVEAFTATEVREARKAKAGPAAVLSAAFRVLGHDVG